MPRQLDMASSPGDPPGSDAHPGRTRPAGAGRSRRSWKRHLHTFGSLTVAGQVESVLSVTTTAALVRMAGATEAGQVLFAQAVATMWFLLWDPRLEDAEQRFVPTQQLSGPGHGTRLYLRLVRLDVAAGVLATVVGVAAAAVAGAVGWISTDRLWLLVLALLAAGAATPSGSASAGFALTDQFVRLGLARLGLAVLGCLATLGALQAAGSIGYLSANLVMALVSTTVLTTSACRHVRRTYGPPVTGPVTMPGGLVSFLVKCSATGSVSAAADSGISVLAGLFGGPALVTCLKIATAPGRLYTSVISPVATQLYPRLARAGAQRRRVAVMSDALRASALTGAIGAVAVVAAGGLIGALIALVYGADVSVPPMAAVVLLAGAALRGTAIWSKVLPSALGRPGVRLAFLTVEGVCQLGILVGVTQLWSSVEGAALAFAWGSLGLGFLSTVGWFIVLRVLARSVLDDHRSPLPRPLKAPSGALRQEG